MKLEDCKPGVRVRVYEYQKTVYCGFIESVVGDSVFVARDYEMQTQAYYPQQLRKIVPKKDRPSIIFACKVGSWSVITDTTDECSIAEFKRQGNVVWLMRGVKKL